MVLKYHARENLQSKLCIHICFLVQLMKGQAPGSAGISLVGNHSVADCYLQLQLVKGVKGYVSCPGISSVREKGTLEDYYNYLDNGYFLCQISKLSLSLSTSTIQLLSVTCCISQFSQRHFIFQRIQTFQTIIYLLAKSTATQFATAINTTSILLDI